MKEKIDALESKLDALGDERSVEKVDALNQLAWEIGFGDVKRQAKLASEALEMARALAYRRGVAWALLNGGYNDYFVADYEAALEKGREALVLFDEIQDRAGRGELVGGLGLVYWSLGDFGQAIEYLHESVEISEELGKEHRGAWALTSLGGVYENLGDLEKSIGCHKRALGLFRLDGDQAGEGRALTGLGTVYQRQGKLDLALEHHFQSLELSRKSKSVTSESRALNDIGTLYLELGDLDRAQDYLEKALTLRQVSGNRPAKITSLLDLGKLFLARGDLDTALEHLHEAFALAIETKARPKIYRAHEALSRTYEALGDYEKALRHHRAFQELKEEVLGEESATRLKNLQIRLEAETVEKLRDAQARLVQSEKMAVLGKLVAGLAHEINTPVGVIRSATDLAARALDKLRNAAGTSASLEELKKGEAFRAAFDSLEAQRLSAVRATERLLTIVESLERFTGIDQAEFQLADIHEGIEATLRLLEPQWGDRIRVVKRFGELPRIESYPTALNQAFMTLLVNAGEAIDGEGTITVETSSENGHVLVAASDTGRGIPRERIDDIFDVGFTRKGSRIRLHVGLASVLSVVERHHGEIRVKSEIDKGTTFEIRLPVKQLR